LSRFLRATGLLTLALAACNDTSGPEPAHTRWISVTAGWGFTCALDEGHNTYCWGDFGPTGGRSVPRLLDTPEPLLEIQASNGVFGAALCGRTASNRVFCWGRYMYGHDEGRPYGNGTDRFEIPGATGLTRIALARGHGCGLMADSTVACWGSYISGKRGRPFAQAFELADLTASPTSGGLRFVRLALGNEFSCGILPDGQVGCWGDSAQVGNPSATFEHQEDPCWIVFVCRQLPTLVPGLTGTVKLATSGYTACALAATGLKCWGALDGPSQPTTLLPRLITVPEAVVDLSVGELQSCALSTSGAAWCWGNLTEDLNYQGPRSPPTRFRISGRTFVTLASGGFHSCGIVEGGALYCWGAGGGALGDGTGKSSVTPVRVAEPS
jgi:alpha-tubulin suppressor-like RCC1 family protein